MLSAAVLLDQMQRQGISYFAGVPDSLLAPFCAEVQGLPADQHVIAVNEGAAIGLAIGHHLGTGRVPLVYMQNSGLGNAVNPLMSLADPDVYGIPLVLLIGWRGAPGEPDEPQHAKQGRITLSLLAALEIPVLVLERDSSDAAGIVARALAAAKQSSGPSAIVVRRGALAGQPAALVPSAFPLRRAAAIAAITASLVPGTAVIATTGMIGRELFDLRARSGGDHASDFLCVGGMGHASQVALGLAASRPGARVLCLDGDGAALMHLGGLATIATSGANLLHVVLNNGMHGSVGGQPTVALRVDLPGVARALGYARVFRADTADQLAEALGLAATIRGPVFLEVRIAPGESPDLGRPTLSPQEAKRLFMGSA
jgi:phosphonopyruvate decarboxylase